MKCPACGNPDLKVIDSRPIEEGNSIRRRRECLQCAKRFTTFEMIEQAQIIVIKKDGSKEPFDRNKLVTGILKSTRKRSVDAEAIVDEIEAELQNTLHLEVPSVELGDLVLAKLRDIDEISYVRFASVYHEFTDVDSFMDELKKLKKKHAKVKKTQPVDN
jgi:transcriptional repressor NrdR